MLQRQENGTARAALFAKPDWRETLFADAVEPPASVVKASKNRPEIVVPPVVEEEEEDEKDKSEGDDNKEDDKSQKNEATEDAGEADVPGETSP